MPSIQRRSLILTHAILAVLFLSSSFLSQSSTQVQPLPGMPAVIDPTNVYSETVAGKMSPAVQGALPRIYVPNVVSADIYVIDPATFKVVDHFNVGGNPQHIIPSWDLKTLWIAGSAERQRSGILTPIDPMTGKLGTTIKVPDAYNLYFTPDGQFAIVVAEALKRLEFRDAHTMDLKFNVATPQCAGVNHADFTLDGRFAVFTCEFSGGGLVKIDLVGRKVVGSMQLASPNLRGATAQTHNMPQDIRITPDGKRFLVADMEADGVFVIDAESFKQTGFIPTARGAHGLYPSRDGKKIYVTNRGTHMGETKAAKGTGSVAVIDFATLKVERTIPIPGGGTPDMGNVSADGNTLWLSGRFDKVVYAIDIKTGDVKTIPVGTEPHGLTVWPQPGRYSLGHTGVMR
jgi:YVTN family beta-propeller protein